MCEITYPLLNVDSGMKLLILKPGKGQEISSHVL